MTENGYDSFDLFDEEFIEEFGSLPNLDLLDDEQTGSWDLRTMIDSYERGSYSQINDTQQNNESGSTYNRQEGIQNEVPDLERLSVIELRTLANRMKLHYSMGHKKAYLIRHITEQWNDIFFGEYMKLLDMHTSYLNQREKNATNRNSARRLLLNWAMAGNYVYLEVVFSNVPSFTIKENGKHVITHIDKTCLIEVTSNTNYKIIGKLYTKTEDPSIPKDRTILEFLFADGEPGVINGTIATIPSFYNETFNAHLVTPLDIDPRFNGMKRSRHVKNIRLSNNSAEGSIIEVEDEIKNNENNRIQEIPVKSITARRKKRVVTPEESQEPNKKKKKVEPKKKKSVLKKKK